MAQIECRSVQPGVPSQWVDVCGITDEELATARTRLDQLLELEAQPSTAVAMAFAAVTTMCPAANPSDIWQHVVYRHLLALGWSDQRWKRVSGFALERALVAIYEPRLADYGIRMRILGAREATATLDALGIDGATASKIDLFLEGEGADGWGVFGAVHVKSSIAERIQDDVPASRAFMERGLLSIALTMDAKSYPPPHGDCVNYGELGGRSLGIEKERIKRSYVEDRGQFDALFSFNARTPPSAAETPSSRRIYAMGLHDAQPDTLVNFLVAAWTLRSGNPA